MYLHLGNGVAVRKPEVLGIFDLDNASTAAITRNYLARAEKAGQVTSVAGLELPKSFVVCAPPGGGRQRVYLCQLNSSTLLKRSEGAGLE